MIYIWYHSLALQQLVNLKSKYKSKVNYYDRFTSTFVSFPTTTVHSKSPLILHVAAVNMHGYELMVVLRIRPVVPWWGNYHYPHVMSRKPFYRDWKINKVRLKNSWHPNGNPYYIIPTHNHKYRKEVLKKLKVQEILILTWHIKLR